MNVLIINPITYTSEVKTIKRAASIKDTMIYDLCLAFWEKGHCVTLYAAEPFKPLNQESYPFEVIWAKCALQTVFQPHRFPYMPGLFRYIKKHKEIDMIISSEVFSLNTLCAVLADNEKVVIWHELAKHNAMMKTIPSKVWYNVVPRLFMRNTKVTARSEQAREFIRHYCRCTTEDIIDHGVNLHKFVASEKKEDYFLVCSQLIMRKRIDGILRIFKEYVEQYGTDTKLYIIGDGNQKEALECLSSSLDLSDRVIFTGKMRHEQLLPLLSHAKALLVNTEKDNSMISIVEAIAVGTPVLTTEVPLNASYIKKYRLGIAKEWDHNDLAEIEKNQAVYVRNCLNYRDVLSTHNKVDQFIKIREV